MCSHCPNIGTRWRLCNVCGQLKTPSPPSSVSFWACKECNPDTAWNLVHSKEFAKAKAARVEPAKILLKKEGTKEWDICSVRDPAVDFITSRRASADFWHNMN